MNFLESILPGHFTRSRLFVFLFFGFTIFLAWKAAQYVLDDDLQSLAMIALSVVVTVVVIIILNNWRKGLYFFLAWLLFEDLIRKFLGNNMVIYFGKDFLVLVVYISFYLAVRRKKAQTCRPPFLIPVLLLVWLGAMQIFNPGSNSVWYGLLGFKVDFYYIPLFFIGYALFDSEAQLRKFFTINVLLAVVIASLGIAQAIVGPQFLNPSNPAEEIRELSTLYRVAPISGAVSYRPTSVFVSDGRFGNFVRVAWLLVLGFSGYLLLRYRKGRTLAFVASILVFAGGLLSGSRGVFVWNFINAGACGIGFLWGAPWRQREGIRILRTLQRGALGIAAGFVLLMLIFPEAIASRLALYSETLSPTSATSELGSRAWAYPVTNFLSAFDQRWPYGYGLGTSTLGVQYVSRILHVKPMNVGVESGYGTLVVEMGVGGLVLWLIMSVAILLAAWKIVRKLKGSPWFSSAFIIFWYALVVLFPFTFAGMQAYQDFILNAYLWLLLGILFRLPTLAASNLGSEPSFSPVPQNLPNTTVFKPTGIP